MTITVGEVTVTETVAETTTTETIAETTTTETIAETTITETIAETTMTETIAETTTTETIAETTMTETQTVASTTVTRTVAPPTPTSSNQVLTNGDFENPDGQAIADPFRAYWPWQILSVPTNPWIWPEGGTANHHVKFRWSPEQGNVPGVLRQAVNCGAGPYRLRFRHTSNVADGLPPGEALGDGPAGAYSVSLVVTDRTGRDVAAADVQVPARTDWAEVTMPPVQMPQGGYAVITVTAVPVGEYTALTDLNIDDIFLERV
jgi:hypothetical protein